MPVHCPECGKFVEIDLVICKTHGFVTYDRTTRREKRKQVRRETPRASQLSLPGLETPQAAEAPA